ncbi:SCO2322 family protein [Kitasatospora sp. NBC_01287]|uniref:SCO2322 family protein n=1 Tax=Kitasatospora sp. NBC_01287 TaxID=2903573 RepID=UPI002257C202|nr:SCO2322 family protein [Kitasatospora sp. NBC_01287]MCX4749404.1 SCO2322 family protein [Kitasatospora sp. NBC_01287]
MRRAAPLALLPLLATALLVTALLGTLAAAGPAAAADYRYWSFWRGTDSGWSYQQQGPAGYRPADGGVDGWRFALSADGGQNAARPAPAPDFATLCAGTPARTGLKRVGVVLDFGTAADAGSTTAPPAPRDGCAQVPPDASSAEVLAALAPPLRYGTDGMLCAIAGYPAAGCGEAAAAPTAAAHATRHSGPALGLTAGGALVLLLGAGALWQARRRRSS